MTGPGEATVRRVLFVDDEERALLELRRGLRALTVSWEMEFVTGGAAALEQLSQGSFHVLVTDALMAGMDGAGLLRRVEELHPQVVRIALAGPGDLRDSLQAAMVAHQVLSKPTELAELKAVVERSAQLKELLADEALQRVVSGLSSLPALPRVYQELSRALSDVDTPMRRIAGIVEEDPAISAKVLQLVNSAYFALPHRVGSIQQAVVYMGTKMLRNVVLSLEVFRALPATQRRHAVLAEKLQQHGLLTARLSAGMLEDARVAEDAFMAGMLHDIGRLVLATKMPDMFLAAQTAAARGGRPLHVVEMEHYGVSHAEVGAYLLGLWGLPYPVVEAVAHHHTPRRVGPQRFDALSAVYVASIVANEVTQQERAAMDEVVEAPDAEYLEELGVADLLPSWREKALAVEGVSPSPLPR